MPSLRQPFVDATEWNTIFELRLPAGFSNKFVSLPSSPMFPRTFLSAVFFFAIALPVFAAETKDETFIDPENAGHSAQRVDAL